MGEGITHRQIEAFGDFLKKLPHGKDRDLVVLKGHLLIEEQVQLIITERLANPSALPMSPDRSGLTSFQLICLAQSFFPDGHEPALWSALKALNKIRNDVSHNINPPGVDDRIDSFTKSMTSALYSDQQNFEAALWQLFVHVSALVEGRLDVGMEIFI